MKERKIWVEDRNSFGRDAAWTVQFRGTAKSAADSLEEHEALTRLAVAVNKVDKATAFGRGVEDAFEELWAANDHPMVQRARRRASRRRG